VDITARKKSEERLALLAKVRSPSPSLQSVLDRRELLSLSLALTHTHTHTGCSPQVGDILSASVDSRLLSVLATVVQHVGGNASSSPLSLSLSLALARSLALASEAHQALLVIGCHPDDSDSVVADWCILDVVDENGALQRIASSRASPDLWELHKRPPDGKCTDT
jgi:hypothetical protein